ncbi:Exosome non-catalytic core component [Recurvomyces mirabilis]|nr:Exosome non-catalytic core component [Recurvomyces mirabilis]
MPLDTSTYALAHLRLDGRRWNELRRLHAQISTQAAADGSSYLEQGNTKILCTVSGPQERKGGRGGARDQSNEAKVDVEMNVAAFSGMDRKRRARSDKRVQEMQVTIASAFQSTLFTHLFPHSTITVTLHILSQDGSLLAACLNAATLALIDAGIPMSDYISAVTVASAPSSDQSLDEMDPLLDLNGLEEQELPFMTVGTCGRGPGGGEEKVMVLVMETKVQMARLEAMLSVGIDGSKQVRGILDGVVRSHGKRVLESKVS